MATMGFSMPSAIGACIANKNATIVDGDGSFRMNMGEIHTILRNSWTSNKNIEYCRIEPLFLGNFTQKKESLCGDSVWL
jgi:hypothetical protein